MVPMRLVSLILLFLTLVVSGNGQSSPTETEARRVTKMFKRSHIVPRLIDDEFSKQLFDYLIANLDPSKMYFTSEDIIALRKHELHIDNDLNGLSWIFYPRLLERYQAALERAGHLIDEAKTTVDVASVKHISSPDSVWADDELSLKNKWLQRFRYELLQELAAERIASPRGTDADFFRNRSQEKTDALANRYAREIRKRLKPSVGFTNQMHAQFISAIGSVFDPHTGYMSKTQMENFLAAVTVEGYQLGIDFEFRDNDVVISGLLPGGPAWKSGQINIGDRVERMRWSGREWVETIGMDENEFDEYFREFNHATLELELRKPGGLLSTVSLRKEKIKTDDNVVRAFVLEGRKKIGYISLPGFYGNWKDEHASCAADVAKEIIKLKKENIDGIVLDLRFNRGGSLSEARDLSGIFIEVGPIALMVEKGRDAIILKDINRGTVYDGPLVVMINGLSASASEVVAASLQDHRRALIVGSTSFGKGVGQQIFAVENNELISNLAQFGPSTKTGYCAITSSKLYRINGKSVQQSGVEPDITFPDVYDIFDVREKSIPFSLPPDSVSKKTYYTPYPSLPVDELRRKSLLRQKDSPTFGMIEKFAGFKSSASRGSGAQITWTDMLTLRRENEKWFTALNAALQNRTNSYRVVFHEFAKPHMQFDVYASQVSEGWMNSLSRDAGLDEAFNIICDFIELQKKL